MAIPPEKWSSDDRMGVWASIHVQPETCAAAQTARLLIGGEATTMGLERYTTGTRYYHLTTCYSRQTGIAGYAYQLPYTGIPGAVSIAEDGLLAIDAGYRWDGCSPKWEFSDMVFGTPEGILDNASGKSKTYYASLVHDALYQLSAHTFSNNERVIADNLFYTMLREADFKAAALYHAVVKTFGRYLWGRG